jgi:hypothetical protein
MSKAVKGGGYLFLALDVYNASNTIANAKPEEKIERQWLKRLRLLRLRSRN